jgi:hypothetical protein
MYRPVHWQSTVLSASIVQLLVVGANGVLISVVDYFTVSQVVMVATVKEDDTMIHHTAAGNVIDTHGDFHENKPPDTLDLMMAWEDDTLSDANTVVLFQRLVNNGQAWKLQGMYGRTASAMLAAGVIKHPSA